MNSGNSDEGSSSNPPNPKRKPGKEGEKEEDEEEKDAPSREVSQSPTLKLGIPGETAFHWFVVPMTAPPAPPKPPNPGSGSLGFSGDQGLAMTVQGEIHSVPIVGSAGEMSRKKMRHREGSEKHPKPGSVKISGDPKKCAICAREFPSEKSLFGHMRSHPRRGWRGAYPPPSFRASDEFDDFRALQQANGTATAAATTTQDTPTSAPQDRGQNRGRNAPEGSRGLPDLNRSPPSDDD